VVSWKRRAKIEIKRVSRVKYFCFSFFGNPGKTIIYHSQALPEKKQCSLDKKKACIILSSFVGRV
jgi:hypothetical protein